MSSRTVAKRGFNLDYIMWLFMRISALALYALGLTGLVAALIMGARTQTDISTLLRWTFFPNPNHVINSNIPDVTLGWANAFWQVMQILIVFFGVTHGLNGLRVVIEDFVGQSIAKPSIRGLIFLLWIFTLIVAIYVVLFS